MPEITDDKNIPTGDPDTGCEKTVKAMLKRTRIESNWNSRKTLRENV